jgi:hypothetical protein
LDLRAWNDFVDNCLEGYDDSLFEYESEIWVRWGIQQAIEDEELRNCEGFHSFSVAVQQADEVFKSVATANLPAESVSGSYWWSVIVPRYGGKEFVSDLRRERGIVIPVKID